VEKALRAIQTICHRPPEQLPPEEEHSRPRCIECKRYSHITAGLCNHRFCIQCAKRHLACWLEASIPSEFPVRCLGCTEPLLWQDIEKILKAQERTLLLGRAYKQYLHTEEDEQYLPCSKPTCLSCTIARRHSRTVQCAKFRCLKCTRPAALHERCSECPFASHRRIQYVNFVSAGRQEISKKTT